MLDVEVDRMIHDQAQQIGAGHNLEGYLAAIGKTDEEARQELRPVADTRLRRSLVLSQLTGAENIEAADDEIEAEIDKMTASAGQQGEQLRQMFDSENGRDTIRRNLLTRKTLARLVEIATQDGGGRQRRSRRRRRRPAKAKRGGSDGAGGGRGRRRGRSSRDRVRWITRGQPSMIIPSVIETSARGERAFDIYSLLLRERIIFLGTGIDDQIANLIIAQLLYLEREDPGEGHQPLHPLAGRPDHGRPRHLRHDAARAARTSRRTRSA